uniref:Beta-1,4-N-acetylgalactosaminyltransferase bre-4 n=1 Tax=Schistocephalus solidus TaxID=70667 RepID=A0A0V0J688_SCHSO
MKRFNYSCLIFHDVDLLPEDDRNLYMCDDEPTHLSATISKFNYTLFYSTSFGGAVAMTPYHFRRVHGYANTYYSWGREDDDMSARLGIAGLPLHRRDFAFARYTMLKHKHESGNKPNPVRNRRYFRAVKLWRKDRYQHVRYTIVTEGLQHRSLYYLLSVNLHPPYRDFDYAKPRNATRRRPHKQRLNS